MPPGIPQLPRRYLLHSRYRIIRLLGSGGFGNVYEATDETFDKDVALKETGVESDKFKRAFEREAKLLAKLSHPNIPRVTDYFFEGKKQYLVMDLISGLSLEELLILRKRPIPYEEVLPWASDLLDALNYLHTLKPYPVIHRDIKPANIRLSKEGKIFLVDFGIAKGRVVEGSPNEYAPPSSSVEASTPQYASLEQIMGAGTDQQSDLYSLGATLYHLMTGQLPAWASERYDKYNKGQGDPLVPPHKANPNIPETVSGVLLRAMALYGRDRTASAAEMWQALLEAEASQASHAASPPKPAERPDIGKIKTAPPTKPLDRIFICYRREDSGPQAYRLNDWLSNRQFPTFMDIDTIPFGADFRQAINEELKSCSIFLALIGKQWVTSEKNGQRRLDNPNDLVRLEIADALSRGISVIPILVQDANMPSANDLPDEIKDLAYRNALSLNDVRWKDDVERLIKALNRLLSDLEERRKIEAEQTRTEEHTQKRAEEAQTGTEKTALRKIQEQQRREEEERQRAEEERRQREVAAHLERQAQEEAARRAEEEARLKVDERKRREAEDARRLEAEEQRKREEQETRRRQEAEEKERLRRETEARKKLEAEEEAARRAEEEQARQRLLEEEQRRREEEERSQAEEREARRLAEEEKRARKEEEARLRQANVPKTVPSPTGPAKEQPLPQEAKSQPGIKTLKALKPEIFVPDNQVVPSGGASSNKGVAVSGRAGYKRIVMLVGGVLLLVIVGVLIFSLKNRTGDQQAKLQGNDPPPPAGMVYVLGGDFMMGRDGDPKGYESPAHPVSVEPFFIDIYEVTNEDYEKFVKTTDYKKRPTTWRNNGLYQSGTGRFPVTGVDWDDAMAYAKWTGKRLPTEEEWEFAARGSDGRLYPWGNDWKSGMANAAGARNGMAEVGFFSGASPYGAYDMVGNAWEWTSSDMKAYPGGRLLENPLVGEKVIRGGSYKSDRKAATVTYRRGWGASGEDDYSYMGFRLAKDAQ